MIPASSIFTGGSVSKFPPEPMVWGLVLAISVCVVRLMSYISGRSAFQESSSWLAMASPSVCSSVVGVSPEATAPVLRMAAFRRVRKSATDYYSLGRLVGNCGGFGLEAGGNLLG